MSAFDAGHALGASGQLPCPLTESRRKFVIKDHMVSSGQDLTCMGAKEGGKTCFWCGEFMRLFVIFDLYSLGGAVDKQANIFFSMLLIFAGVAAPNPCCIIAYTAVHQLALRCCNAASNVYHVKCD